MSNYNSFSLEKALTISEKLDTIVAEKQVYKGGNTMRDKLVKNVSGITLVSLIITIIVLLILAGITFTALIGDNGVINRAKTASTAYELSSFKEKIQMELTNLQTEILVSGGEITGTQVKAIITKYEGDLQADNDTIKIKGNELKLTEIWDGKINFDK